MTSRARTHSNSLQLSELVGFIVSQTGWTLDYVCSLPLSQLRVIGYELQYQKALRDYETAAHTISLQLAMARLAGGKHNRNVRDVLGEPPRHVEQEGLFMAQSTVTLGNGQSYLIRPVNLNMMADVEQTFGEAFPKLLESQRMAVIRRLLYLMLHEDNESLTEERVGQLVTIDVLAPLAEQIVKQVNG